MKNHDRRDFLKTSLLGIAGATMIPTASSASSASDRFLHQKTLACRVLGKTGLQVPLLSVGTGNMNTAAFVRLAYEEGLRLFFTASYYGEGNNEKMLGEAVREYPRDQLVIGTAGIPKGIDHRNGLYTKDSTYEALVADAEGSLRRFGMDYVDILLLPYAARRESVFFEPLLRAMEDLKKQGKARFIGIASHSRPEEALRAAADTGVYDLAMVSYNFRTENKAVLDQAIHYAAVRGLGIIAMKTQAGGYWDRERTQPINARAAMKWVLQNEQVSTIVSGMTTIDQLRLNLSMLGELNLTEQEQKDLRLTGSTDHPGLYCQQCSKCLSQCPYEIDIPTIMRSYMYAYGYGDTFQARKVLDQAGLADEPCHSCASCRVECTSHFNVKGKVTDIARLGYVPPEFLQG